MSHLECEEQWEWDSADNQENRQKGQYIVTHSSAFTWVFQSKKNKYTYHFIVHVSAHHLHKLKSKQAFY